MREETSIKYICEICEIEYSSKELAIKCENEHQVVFSKIAYAKIFWKTNYEDGILSNFPSTVFIEYSNGNIVEYKIDRIYPNCHPYNTFPSYTSKLLSVNDIKNKQEENSQPSKGLWRLIKEKQALLLNKIQNKLSMQ